MRLLEPIIIELGFKKQPKGLYYLALSDGLLGRLMIYVPQFHESYRIDVSLHDQSEIWVPKVRGPMTYSLSFKNPPGGKRYDFSFSTSSETHIRCTENLEEWINKVALPWLKSIPKKDWKG